ncbi:hypothetical protein AYO44_12840 [Planctomycetaceae bacterium SCGC AG-212-F19]|nr:hypothetical protein AYO44_12840 [Planctomycetaceae bacterium SCGC AG-212-F19]
MLAGAAATIELSSTAASGTYLLASAAKRRGGQSFRPQPESHTVHAAAFQGSNAKLLHQAQPLKALLGVWKVMIDPSTSITTWAGTRKVAMLTGRWESASEPILTGMVLAVGHLVEAAAADTPRCCC